MINISKENIIDIHENILNVFGGSYGIKDEGALESSLNNAFSTFFGEDLYKTDVDKISNIFYLLNKNHGFVDANKRTAVSVFNILVKINDINIEYKLKELEEIALKAVINEITADEVTTWIYNKLV